MSKTIDQLAAATAVYDSDILPEMQGGVSKKATAQLVANYMYNKNQGRILPLINLGTSYTQELKNDISSGTFEKAVVGGYLTINGHKYYLAHPDYWLHTGDTECTTHHMLVVPVGNLTSGKMNSTNITTGGYVGSDFYTGNNDNTALANVIAIIEEDFGADNILTHREKLSNAVTGNNASGSAWYYSKVDLMNENMVYGAPVCGKGVDGSGNYNVGIDKSQIRLFAERPDIITTRANWWLRGVVSSAGFAYIDSHGDATHAIASASLGFRPAFAIC